MKRKHFLPAVAVLALSAPLMSCGGLWTASDDVYLGPSGYYSTPIYTPTPSSPPIVGNGPGSVVNSNPGINNPAPPVQNSPGWNGNPPQNNPPQNNPPKNNPPQNNQGNNIPQNPIPSLPSMPNVGNGNNNTGGGEPGSNSGGGRPANMGRH